MLDSSADFSIFSTEIAAKLGINLNKNKKIYFSGVNGEAIEGTICRIILEIGKASFNTNIIFSNIGTHALLGQYGFFDFFIVKFDLKKEEIELKEHY